MITTGFRTIEGSGSIGENALAKFRSRNHSIDMDDSFLLPGEKKQAAVDILLFILGRARAEMVHHQAEEKPPARTESVLLAEIRHKNTQWRTRSVRSLDSLQVCGGSEFG